MSTKMPSSVQAGPSGLAIATFVLGCLGWCTAGFTSLIALPMGAVEISNIRKGRSSQGGLVLTKAGLIVAAIALIFILLLISVYVAIFGRFLGFSNEAMRNMSFETPVEKRKPQKANTRDVQNQPPRAVK